MKNMLVTIVALILLGCSTLPTHIVTITKIRDSAMKELAALNAQGKISAETDAKIAKADLAYRQSAETCEKALIAYQAGGSVGDYTVALQAVKAAVTGILDILTPFLTPDEATAYRTKLVKAQTL